MKKLNKVQLATVSLGALLCVSYAYAAAVPTVDLGSTEDFSVLAGSTITNTGSSVIDGDLGLSPGTSVTGFPPGVINGSQHIANTDATEAKNDLVSAYNDARGRTPVSTIGAEMGGSTILPGVYSAGTLGITGTVTLDAQGDPNAVFIFQADSTLTTAASSNVALTGEAQACNVFWQVGSSATLGANSNLKGTILALTSITLTTGADVEGRVFARNGAVTLDSNNISETDCEVAPIITETEEEVTEDEDTTEATATPVVITVQATTTPIVTPVIAITTITPALPPTGSRPIHQDALLLLAILTLGLSGTIIVLKGKAKA